MKKINLYINGEYMCSSFRYSRCRDFIDRVIKDKKIVVVASIPDRVIYIKDTDRVTAHFAK